MATVQTRKPPVSKATTVKVANTKAPAATKTSVKATVAKPATKAVATKPAEKSPAKAVKTVAEKTKTPAKATSSKAAAVDVTVKQTELQAGERKKPKRAAAAPVQTAAEALAEKRRQYAAQFFPYIEKVARRLARRLPAHVEIDDLVSSGVIGLMEAAERFDPNRVDRFEAFAEFRIRGAMLDDLRSRDTLSRDMRRLSNELREATRKLESQLGRTPDQQELANTLGVDVEELYARQQKLSGSSVVGIDDAGPDFLERTCDETSPDPFELTSHRETLGRLVQGIGRLPDKMQQVLSLYYIENLNLKEIGTVLGVTESRVCQIHGEATRRLRETLTDLEEAAA
ncbi:MAG: RNA polymerase sigma factor FliA [Deltaproteobacteria bacterium]|nr:RNA polymerase sigma factor FliA [Deltaproteobacteria bacterium]